MAVRFADGIIDGHIAPQVSMFTTASIPDMSNWAKESRSWTANFFLNSVLRAAFKPPMNAYAFNFLRRVQFAFVEHDLARADTLDFLANGKQSATRYCAALHHWEVFLAQAWHAYNLLVKAFNERAFESGDRSVEERLNRMYNAMKHVESRIENGQMLPAATIPVWLMNDGIQSVDAALTYDETAEVLKDLAAWADSLVDPRGAKDAIFKLNTPDADESQSA